ncbi:hypothetical protein NGF19_18335 [Streptomyces sp. RY43-2]|uniref:Lipoprotein n=1 Tax=Streptomyces macrolidinus TaxID=2952607 RepID=A0ABT0ZGP9_9ACTN|nr:hypothetical protein [Streptomyces macrolidinus]MCN9242731.1 hypothetical protein [Streptomyces macrolidinus]
MPFPPYPRTSLHSTSLRRRSLLASVVGAALLAGCSGAPDSATTAAASLSRAARARAARDSEKLAERYTAVIAAHPALAARLRPLRAEVLRHARAFGEGLDTSPSPSATTSPSPSPTPSPVPTNPEAAVALLAAAERALADRRTAALLEVPGELARLMASVAAAGAAHAYLLTKGAQ